MMAARGTPGGLPKALLEACNKFSAALGSGTTLPTISDILATLQGNKAPALPSTQGSAR
jgi:hypothetical protein